MRIDQFLIGFIVFSAVVVTGMFIIQDINVNYGLDISTDEFNQSYDVIDEMYNISQTQKNHTLGAQISEDEAWESSVKGSYSSVRQVRNTFELEGAIMEDIADQLNVPTYFIVIGQAALLILIIFAVIYLFMRFKPQD